MAQGNISNGVAQVCKDTDNFGGLFPTLGACLGAFATSENPGDAGGVGECKYVFALYNIPQRYIGECIRELQGGQ